MMFGLQKRCVDLSPEHASEIYKQHVTKLFFPILVTYMSSAPMLVLQLARERAVSYMIELTGPTNPARARITHPDWSDPFVAIDRYQSASCIIWEGFG